jgi:membrane protein implicated in regulation of membrane protease activity
MSACPSCGEELPGSARFCPACGAPADAAPPLESVQGPVARDRVEPRWFGLPAAFVLLCLGFAALGAAIGLFATGDWAWGVVAIFAAVVLFAALAEMTRGGRRERWTEGSSRVAADRRAQAATTAEVWRTRLDSSLTRWRKRSELDRIESERKPALQALGAAVWNGDAQGEDLARERLRELEAERERVETELASHLTDAEERIRRARLPVQDTVMVTPNEPNAPYPPPGEADPPQPAEIPEPYPPPDEGTPPAPAPDPGDE